MEFYSSKETNEWERHATFCIVSGKIARHEADHMKASIEIKADILKAMMADDRQEVRAARSLVYSVNSAFIIASFTLTSILLKPDLSSGAVQARRADHIIFMIDILIIPVMWVIFGVLKRYVTHAQQCVRLRQDLINDLNEKDTEVDLNIAPWPKHPPDIKHNDLWWIPGIATVVIALQVIVIAWTH